MPFCLPSHLAHTHLSNPVEAAFHDHADVLRLLIEHNADLNTCSGIGWTALHYCGQANNPKCVELLLAAGADAKMTNDKGKTAAMRATEQQKQSVIDIFSKFS